MNETRVTVIGNVVDEPSLRFTPGGAPVLNFRIASTPRKYDKQSQQWTDGDPLFLGVTAWRSLAENGAESLHKGMKVIIYGDLQQRQFERNDGTKGSSYDVVAEDIGPALSRNTAQVTKANGNGQQRPQNGQQPAADPWANNGQQSNGWGQQGQQQPQRGYSDEPPF